MNSIPQDPDFSEGFTDGEFAPDSQEKRPKQTSKPSKNQGWKPPIPPPREIVKSDAVAAIDSKKDLFHCQSVSKIMSEEEAKETDAKIIKSATLLGERLYNMCEREGYRTLGFKSFSLYVKDVFQRTDVTERSLWRYLAKARLKIEAHTSEPSIGESSEGVLEIPQIEPEPAPAPQLEAYKAPPDDPAEELFSPEVVSVADAVVQEFIREATPPAPETEPITDSEHLPGVTQAYYAEPVAVTFRPIASEAVYNVLSAVGRLITEAQGPQGVTGEMWYALEDAWRDYEEARK